MTERERRTRTKQGQTSRCMGKVTPAERQNGRTAIVCCSRMYTHVIYNNILCAVKPHPKTIKKKKKILVTMVPSTTFIMARVDTCLPITLSLAVLTLFSRTRSRLRPTCPSDIFFPSKPCFIL